MSPTRGAIAICAAVLLFCGTAEAAFPGANGKIATARICATTTAAQAVLPGSLTGGNRAVWELRRFDLYDGDGARFLTQGLFVP